MRLGYHDMHFSELQAYCLQNDGLSSKSLLIVEKQFGEGAGPYSK
jgi:hypothetical protein